MRAGMLLVALICLGVAGPIEAPPERSFAVERLLLSFTVLSQERDSPAVRQALDALGAATFRPAAEP